MNRVLLLALLGVALCAAAHHEQTESHYLHHEPSYWQGLKKAVSDMNPFSSRLGHDWSDTQNKVEDIYRDMHVEAQRRVDDLKEDSLKGSKALQQRIAEIYADAAAEAEKKIDKLKRPLLAQLWRSRAHDEHEEHDDEYPTHGAARHYYDKAKGAVSDAAASVKKRLLPDEEHSMFDDVSKKISDIYKGAVNKAKSSTADLPSAGETWQETKRKARDAYDELLHAAHGESRSKMSMLRDKLGRGIHRTGEIASGAAYRTWHLLLHMMLGAFWLALGVAVSTGVRWWMAKQTFKKQLASNVAGPVILTKEFIVVGTDETQRKFQDYFNNAASTFFQRQPGMRKFSLQRGVNVGSNCWQHLSEWNSIEDLRRALNNPELNEIKKRMPKGVISSPSICQVQTTGKGTAQGGGGAPQEGEVLRGAEGLRQRGGPGATQQQ